MLENIRLSLQGIWSHKMRSFLTMLGIIIGIAAIIAIVSTIKGTNEQIKQNLIGSGNNTVEISLYQGNYQYQTEYYGIPNGIYPLSDEIISKIEALDYVVSVSKYLFREYADQTFYQGIQLEGMQIYGIDQQYLSTCGYMMSRGRGFTNTDLTEYKKVAIIDKASAKAAFQNEDPIGQTIEIKGEPYVVIGVTEKASAFKPVIHSIEDYYTYSGRDSGVIFIPISTWPIIYNFDEPENVLLRVTSTDDMSAAGRQATEILNSTIQSSSGAVAVEEISENTEDSAGDMTESSKIKYKAADLTERAKNLQELSQATNKQLIWIASISLLVGGIGVMNIMLVSVTERTREIGLKKAIGAKNSHILGQFLTEAAILTSLGGILGVITGIVLAQIISKVSATPVAISVPAIIFSVAFSMLIGIVFGLMPSIKASRLNPIDALRHE